MAVICGWFLVAEGDCHFSQTGCPAGAIGILWANGLQLGCPAGAGVAFAVRSLQLRTIMLSLVATVTDFDEKSSSPQALG